MGAKHQSPRFGKMIVVDTKSNMKKVTVYHLVLDQSNYSNGQSLVSKDEAMMPLSKISFYLEGAKERGLNFACELGYLYIPDEEAEAYESLGYDVSSTEHEVSELQQVLVELFPPGLISSFKMPIADNPNWYPIFQEALNHAERNDKAFVPRLKAALNLGKQIEIIEEELKRDCPSCGKPHSDIDEWALKPHKTHLCLHCGALFEADFKGVCRPSFDKITQPLNVVFVPF